MRLRSTLLHIAQIAILAPAGCGGSIAPASVETDSGPYVPGDDSGLEASVDSGDAAPDVDLPEVACGGCGCNNGPTVPSGNASPAQACAIAGMTYGGPFGGGPACDAYCQSIGNTGGGFSCSLPQSYFDAYQSAQGDGGGGGDAGADGGPVCPAWNGDVVIGCGYNCTGRRTEGVMEVAGCAGESVGAMLAGRATLEAVSIHAFATLERELAAHGAPAALLRDARRARRDEVRHTAMMTRLARRFGGEPRAFVAPPAAAVRSLLAIALENAVEGCVRETYGAVVGLVEARASRDAGVRRAMRSIAADECRHAELAWAVAAWVMPRLTPDERATVDRAMHEAVRDLGREGERGIVRLLAERVWRQPRKAAA